MSKPSVTFKRSARGAAEPLEKSMPKMDPPMSPTLIQVDIERLLAEKSIKIIYANALRRSGSLQEARSLFLEAAEMELAIHRYKAASTQTERDFSNLLSAASCYWQAGIYDYALEIFDRIIAQASRKSVKSEALSFRSRCMDEMLQRHRSLQTYPRLPTQFSINVERGKAALRIAPKEEEITKREEDTKRILDKTDRIEELLKSLGEFMCYHHVWGQKAMTITRS